MSRLLGKMLQSEGALFNNFIATLEKASGETALDASLLADKLRLANLKIKQLGFASADVTIEELTIALENKIKTAQSDLQLRADWWDLLRDELETIELWEISEVGLERVNISPQLQSNLLSDSAACERVAKLPKGYFETNAVRLIEQSDDNQSLFSANLSLSRQADLKTILEALIDLEHKILFSNQLSIILNSTDFQIGLARFLKNQSIGGWLLFDDVVPLKAINDIMADSNSQLGQLVTMHYPLLAEKLSDYDVYGCIKRLLNDDFWQQTEALMLVNDNNQIISFNIFDLCLGGNNYVVQYLWSELIGRYLTNYRLTEQIFNQLIKRLEKEGVYEVSNLRIRWG